MKLLLTLCALLGLCGGAEAVKEVAQMALYGMKFQNSFDDCFFIYGTPMIGLREESGDELIGETEWFDTCSLPWGMDEMAVFCNAFGYHTVHEDWPMWDLYDSIFNVTRPDNGAGCDKDAHASMGDCDFGTKHTPACDGVDQDDFYEDFDTPDYKVRPIVFCQAGTDRVDPYPCLNEGDFVAFSELMHWKNDGLGRFDARRKKREVSDSKFKIYTSENDIKKVGDVVAKRERPTETNDKKPRENLLLADPLGLKTRFPVDPKTAKGIEAFWHLLDKFAVEHEDHIEETRTGLRGRYKRATLGDNYCADSNLVSVFEHYSECHCKDGYKETFCERDIDECYPVNPCNGTGVICRNTEGSYHCECVTGYELAPNQHECIDIDECAQDPSPCESPRICRNTKGGCFCDCPVGYRLNSETDQCEDINECNEGGCSQNCTNTDGSFTCTCFSGYVLETGQRTCEDIDECENPGICNLTTSTCRNTPGTYRCDCKEGYEKDSNGDCVDIDECTVSNPCTNDRSECINTEGGYTCACPQNRREDQWGACVEFTDITIEVTIEINFVWLPIYSVPGHPVFQDVCDSLGERTNPGNAFGQYNFRNRDCDSIEVITDNGNGGNGNGNGNNGNGNGNGKRKKRQTAGTTTLVIGEDYSFDQNLNTAELSQVTYTVQESLADQTIDITVPDLGTTQTADIIGRAELTAAPGLDLNSTGGEITEVCYLFNLLEECLEGSTCVAGENNMPMCECAEGFSGDRCDEQVVSALSTSTIFLLAACIGLFFALLGLCISHVYHMKRMHNLEKFVGYRYHMIVMNDEQYAQYAQRRPASATDSTWDRPRSWLPQPIRRHHGQSPAYFSHWS